MDELKLYLEDEDITVKKFADLIKRSENAVYMWLRGERKPCSKSLSDIFVITKGRVPPNSFLDLPDLSHLNTITKSVKPSLHKGKRRGK